MDKLRLCVYNSLNELSILRSAWDDLLSRYPQATTFSTWEWLSCWWHCFGDNRQLLALALFDSDSLRGLALFSISKERAGCFSLRVLRLMGDGSGDSDNLDMPVHPGYEKLFTEKILQSLWHQKHLWDICLLNTIPPGSPVAGRMSEILKSSSWICFEAASSFSAVALPRSWELYVQTLASEDRKNLTRYTRRLQARYSSRVYRCAEPAELPACLEALFRLHQGRWRSAGQPGSFSSVERRKFYDELSRCFLARDWLELWVLELDKEIAAVQFAFRYKNTAFQLQEGYDHQRSSDRIGSVLRAEVIKQLISRQIVSYDFLGGEDPYKTRWGAQIGHYQNLQFARSRSIGGIWLQAMDSYRRSKQWLRQKLPNVAWKLLHAINIALRKE
jgi:CelD/BcsL family acetyltransferase involved in cellulose biosynthesis